MSWRFWWLLNGNSPTYFRRRRSNPRRHGAGRTIPPPPHVPLAFAPVLLVQQISLARAACLALPGEGVGCEDRRGSLLGAPIGSRSPARLPCTPGCLEYAARISSGTRLFVRSSPSTNDNSAALGEKGTRSGGRVGGLQLGFASVQLGHFLGQLRERFLTGAKPLKRHGTLLHSADVDVDLFDRRRLVVAPGFRHVLRNALDQIGTVQRPSSQVIFPLGALQAASIVEAVFGAAAIEPNRPPQWRQFHLP
jgi:hypothetical protein